MQQRIFFSALAALVLSFSQVQGQEEGEFHLDDAYALSANGIIHLNSEDADVRITGSDRSDVHVKIDRIEYVNGIRSGSRNFTVNVEEVNGDLVIKERRSGSVRFSIGSFRTEYSITIEMPRSGGLKIEGEDDDYVIKNVDGSISMRVEDGDIELLDTKSESIEVRIEDGDLRLDGGLGELMIENEDGDLDVRNGAFTRVDIETEDANVSIETSLADDGTYEITSDDARIDFVVLSGGGRFYVSKDDGRVSSGSAFKIEEERDHRVTLSLAGGKADVDVRVNDGRVRFSKR
ncbi:MULTISPECIES: DUF4097 family beta strand repeat-containing protein [Roseivirga]|uniref:DUF4097 domain-containing protein n=1 Tax=Roseivirga spongicola TaxID=333140 RepID=A0A150XET0_9BACT|nr:MULTISPECIES: DUF4097 family beta strand repeat-containing protein [Roseivirga]KYG77210.1 hypothetical protein AWW68_00120 [Roseivirga spongicola]MBO6662707.1 DUF4097 family beta strand repeat protein [Roseivirga sp.]MBO6909714.1 DUF4097 family beta strand repeat protein [Roseivirga sp.]WPZ10909.1 DUF4097 family beta strand repeat-containing protein [Roseivirga spongicola]